MRLGRSAAAAVGLAIVVQSAVTEVTYCHVRSVSRLQVFSGGQSRFSRGKLSFGSPDFAPSGQSKYDLLAGTPLEDIPFKCVHHGTPKGKQLFVKVRKKRPSLSASHRYFRPSMSPLMSQDEANVSRVQILSCTHYHHPGHHCEGLIPFYSVAGGECMHCSEGLLCCLIACVGFWSGTTRANCTLVASSTERTDIGTSNPFYLPQLCLTLDKEKAHPRLDQRNATVGWICEDNKCHPMQCHATGLLLRWKVTKARWCAALETSLLIGSGR